MFYFLKEALANIKMKNRNFSNYAQFIFKISIPNIGHSIFHFLIVPLNLWTENITSMSFKFLVTVLCKVYISVWFNMDAMESV